MRSDAKKTRPIEGMRERKRRQTRERIANSAMTLFLRHGFEATTVDDVAAAADVSKRSFFDYFPTKEDLIVAWQDQFGEALAAAVAARPSDEPLVRTVEEALISSIVAAINPQSMAIGQLIRETPALRARDHLKYAKLEQRLANALIERTSEANALRARLLAMIAVGAMRVGNDDWHARSSTEPVELYAKKITKLIWSELEKLGREPRE